MEGIIGYKIIIRNEKMWYIILWNCEFNSKAALNLFNQQLESNLKPHKCETINHIYKFTSLMKYHKWLKRYFVVLGQQPKGKHQLGSLNDSQYTKTHKSRITAGILENI